MLVVMRHGATPEEINGVVRVIEEMGYEARPMPGAQRTTVGLVGNDGRVDSSRVEALPGVAEVIHVTQPYKQVSREWRPDNTLVTLGTGVVVGGRDVVVIGGPCSVETEEQIVSAARAVRAAGASCLRGGAFKPRSSPYSFQGLGVAALELLEEAKAETGLPIVTELMDQRDLEQVLDVADVIQVGARNMQNYTLLAEIGRSGRAVLLKRGLAATLEELLMAAEYILKEGNEDVILCERGIRTFETATRFTLDIMAIPVLKQLTHLPVVVDPSHAAGRRDLVLPLSLAAAAAGADGIIVEVHHDPEAAICDGPQAVPADEFSAYVEQVQRVASIVGKELSAL
jgi:3-deoxy-7-phosphoheptulonate synthase